MRTPQSVSLLPVTLLLAAPVWGQAPAKTCLPTIRDAAAPSTCIAASSIPAPGALLPLGPELFVAPTGEVGIGTMTPEHRLDVAGHVRARDRCAFGADASIGPDIYWDWLFEFSDTITDFSTASSWDPWASWIALDPDQDLVGPSETWIYSHDLYVHTVPGNDKDIYSLNGPFLLADHQGSGTIHTLGGAFIGATNTGTGHVGVQYGGYIVARGHAASTVGTNVALGVASGHTGSGSIDDDRGLLIAAPAAGGTITNHYGLFIEDQDVGLQDSYAIYSEGGTCYLAGDLGLGTDTPGAKLDVAGDFVASGTKSFVEPHPFDPTKEIRFVCLEGNEAGTYFRGEGWLAGGVAILTVPEEFALVTEAEGLTVQLTPHGPGADLWVSEKGLDRIVVRGQVDVGFDYFVNGVRHGYAGFQVVRDRARATSNAAQRRDDPPRVPRDLELMRAPRIR